MNELKRHYEEKYAADASGASESVIVEPTGTPRDRFAACVSFLQRTMPVGSTVLELGGGDGRVSASILASGLSPTRLVVSEFADVRLAGLRRVLEGTPTEIVRVDAEHVDPDVGTFDIVLMVALIEHLIDPMRAMQRIRDLVNPGGFVYIDTPNMAKWTRRIKLLSGRFPSTASQDEGLITYEGTPVDLYDEGHLHYFTFRSLERMLIDRCGFSRVERIPYSIDNVFPDRFGTRLSKIAPTWFSELAVAAWV